MAVHDYLEARLARLRSGGRDSRILSSLFEHSRFERPVAGRRAGEVQGRQALGRSGRAEARLLATERRAVLVREVPRLP